MPPKIIAKNTDRTGGVLPVSAAARAASAKGPASRLKLEVRRLPPGLTLSEFEEVLGDEWKLGNGKVDWREYRQGKTRAAGSGKVPEQSRCYLHVVNDACVKDFEKRFLEVAFQDKAGTHKNPDLKNLQPSLGFAPNQRTPLQQAKPRTDNRQGTIDQDPEFIAFLEAETQPIAKPAAVDASTIEKENQDPKTTPLVADLIEKKANKAKAAQAKAEKAEKDKKAQSTKSAGKDAAPVADKDAGKVTTQPQTPRQKKVEQAAKDAAKVLNKQAAAKQQQPQPTQQPKVASPGKLKKQAPSPKPTPVAPAQPAAAAASASSAASASPAPQRIPPAQRQRGNADGIKKMLQKDLGIKPKNEATAPQSTASTPSVASPKPTTAIPTTTPKAAPPTAPKFEASSTPAPTQSTEPRSPPTKAYLKHANPSQGMTEVLIQQALSQYGELSNVTIDPRKGTAIAVFKDNEGLKKALEAKRVPVASGAVEVLEFRDRTAGGSTSGSRGGYRGGRGGRGGNRGGSAPTAPTAASSATPAA